MKIKKLEDTVRLFSWLHDKRCVYDLQCLLMCVHQHSNLTISHVDLRLTLQNPALQKQTAMITCPPTKTLLHQGASML